jgi:hypothetical protein
MGRASLANKFIIKDTQSITRSNAWLSIQLNLLMSGCSHSSRMDIHERQRNNEREVLCGHDAGNNSK